MTTDESKTKEQLLDELAELRRRVSSHETAAGREENEGELQRRTSVLDAVNQVFQEALACETDVEVAAKCLHVAERLTGSQFGFIGEINDAGLFDTMAISNPGWDECKMPDSEATKVIRSMPLRGVDRGTMRDECARIVNDPASHPEHVETPEGHPRVTCFLGVPLKQAGQTIGMIGLANKTGGYELADQEAIEALSVAFVEALKSKRSEIEVRGYRDNLERMVEERTAELRASKEQLETEAAERKRAQETIQRQAEEILEISTPVMQVWEGVVIAPLIGTLDSQRTERFMERLLESIVETRSPVALVDITGVPTIDTQTAQHLVETITAVRLLGAEVALTGVSPAIAQTLVQLGVDLSTVATRSSLAAGLSVAMEALGLKVVPKTE